MDISSTSNSSYNRSVTPSKSSSDRQYNDEVQASIAEDKAQERAQQRQAAQEKLQQYKQDNERRLDGRLVSFGYQEDGESSQQKQASFNRSRVQEAYSPPAQNELTNSHKQQQRSNESKNDAIDIVA